MISPDNGFSPPAPLPVLVLLEQTLLPHALLPLVLPAGHRQDLALHLQPAQQELIVASLCVASALPLALPEVGCLARLLAIAPLPEGGHQLLLHGLRRTLLGEAGEGVLQLPQVALPGQLLARPLLCSAADLNFAEQEVLRAQWAELGARLAADQKLHAQAPELLQPFAVPQPGLTLMADTFDLIAAAILTTHPARLRYLSLRCLRERSALLLGALGERLAPQLPAAARAAQLAQLH